MTTRPPVSLWQLVGTSLLCGTAVVVSTEFAEGLNGIVAVSTWIASLLLLTVGTISLIQHSPRITQASSICVSLLFVVGTIFLLPSEWTLITSFLAGVQLLLTTGFAFGFPSERQIGPARVAIKVTSNGPSSKSAKTSAVENSISHEEAENESIDSKLEQALLSRLSVEQNQNEDGFTLEESTQNRQSIQFESAESHILQRYERGLDPEGREWLEGTVRVDFIRNQKTAVIHIPFWPAFQFRPQVNSELLEGPHLKIDIKTVERWGVRLELTRRAAGLDPDSAELAFFVTTESKARGAA